MEQRKEQNQNKKRIESEYKKNDTKTALHSCKAVLHELYTVVDNSNIFPTVFFVPFYFLFFAEKPAILLVWVVWNAPPAVSSFIHGYLLADSRL